MVGDYAAKIRLFIRFSKHLSKIYYLNVLFLKKKVYLCAQLDLKQIKNGTSWVHNY